MWSSARSGVPHPLLHLPPQPTLPGPAAFLQRQQLRGPSLLPDGQGQAPSAPGLLDHPRGHWSWTPPQQGGHRGPQRGSQAEAVVQAACELRGPDSGSNDAGEAVRAVQHPGGEGMSGSAGLLHDGDGTDTGGDAAPQSWREGPGAVLRGHSHWLDTEDSVQTDRIPTATAERHGETLLCISRLIREGMWKTDCFAFNSKTVWEPVPCNKALLIYHIPTTQIHPDTFQWQKKLHICNTFFLPINLSITLCSITSTPALCAPWCTDPQSSALRCCPAALQPLCLSLAAGSASAAKPVPTSSSSPETSPLTPSSMRGRASIGTTPTPPALSPPSPWEPRATSLRETPLSRSQEPPSSSSRSSRWESQPQRSPRRRCWTGRGRESVVAQEAGRSGWSRTWLLQTGAPCWASSCLIRSTSSSRPSWTTGNTRCCSSERGRPTAPVQTDRRGGPLPFRLPWCFAVRGRHSLHIAQVLTAGRSS